MLHIYIYIYTAFVLPTFLIATDNGACFFTFCASEIWASDDQIPDADSRSSKLVSCQKL